MRSLFALCLLFAFSAVAQTPGPIALPQLGVPSAPPVSAKAYIVRDFNSGKVLLDFNSAQRIDPASMTKLMTGYLVFAALNQGRLKLDQVVPVSQKAYHAEGSRMFIEPKQPVTVDELLHGMIVQSGNDASIALAEAVAGSEESFADLMNKQAAALGMKNSHFMNSTGLPHPQHYSSAEDLSFLATAIIRDFPQFYPYYSIKEYRYNGITQPNRNRLLWLDPFVDGMKTGHTEAAGYCLVTSAKRGSMRLISVLAGAPSDSARASESQKLLNYAFQFYETQKLYDKNQAIAEVQVWKGKQNSLKIGPGQAHFVTLPRGQYKNLKATLLTNQPLIAPLAGGQPVGKLRVSLGEKVLVEYPVVALETVPVANFLKRSLDSIKLAWRKL